MIDLITSVTDILRLFLLCIFYRLPQGIMSHSVNKVNKIVEKVEHRQTIFALVEKVEHRQTIFARRTGEIAFDRGC